MARINTGLVALAFGVLLAGACNHNKHGDTVVSNGAQSASMGDPKDDLTFLPADSEIVIGINVAQVKQSALWGQYAAPALAKMSAELGDFKTACGFDPVEAIQSVALGMKNVDSDSPDAVFVVRGPKRALVTSGCLTKLQQEAQKNGETLTIDGDTYTHTSKSGDHAAMRFVGDTTLVVSAGTQGTKEGLAAIAKGGSGLDTSPAFSALIKGLDRSRSMWFAVNGNMKALQQMAAMGAKPTAVFGTVNITDGVAFDGAMRFSTPDEAQSLLAMSKTMTDNPQVKAMFDKLEINANGTDLTASAAIGPDKLKMLLGMFMQPASGGD